MREIYYLLRNPAFVIIGECYVGTKDFDEEIKKRRNEAQFTKINCAKKTEINQGADIAEDNSRKQICIDSTSHRKVLT